MARIRPRSDNHADKLRACYADRKPGGSRYSISGRASGDFRIPHNWFLASLPLIALAIAVGVFGVGLSEPEGRAARTRQPTWMLGPAAVLGAWYLSGRLRHFRLTLRGGAVTVHTCGDATSVLTSSEFWISRRGQPTSGRITIRSDGATVFGPEGDEIVHIRVDNIRDKSDDFSGPFGSIVKAGINEIVGKDQTLRVSVTGWEGAVTARLSRPLKNRDAVLQIEGAEWEDAQGQLVLFAMLALLARLDRFSM